MKYLVNGIETDLVSKNFHPIQIKKIHHKIFIQTISGTYTALIAKHGDKIFISCNGCVYDIKKNTYNQSLGESVFDGEFRAPMPGQVVDILVKEDMHIVKGQKLVILEAMKTQQPIIAPVNAKVISLPVKIGSQLQEGDLIVKIEPLE